jgi:hypothetical protein
MTRRPSSVLAWRVDKMPMDEHRRLSRRFSEWSKGKSTLPPSPWRRTRRNDNGKR